MASHVVIGATGEGHEFVSGGSPVTFSDVQWNIKSITSPRVRTIGSVEPIQQQYAGVVGLAQLYPAINGTSPDVYIVIWTSHLNWDNGDDPMPSYGPYQGDTIFWKLPLGLTADLAAFW